MITPTQLRDRAIAEAQQLVRDVATRIGDPTAKVTTHPGPGELTDAAWFIHAHAMIHAGNTGISLVYHPHTPTPTKVITVYSVTGRCLAGRSVDEVALRWEAVKGAWSYGVAS